jgi:nicotinate-nucleotide--dimethylbenzimidazole phosphoribosyltransferase
VRGEEMPETPRPALCVFCADHGVSGEGVSAYPREVTRQMVLNLAAGGAAINVLCRHAGIELTVVDMGVDSEPFQPPVRNEKVGRGTKNMLLEPAMSRAAALQCVGAGIRLAGEAADSGATLLAAGEMGIGNTTAASAVGAVLAAARPLDVVGHGTGIQEAAWRRKVQIVNQILAARRPRAQDPIEVLATVGGFEIAAMAGYYLGAGARRIPAIVDGFIATVAALAALKLSPNLSSYLLWAHQSAERGHSRLLDAVSAEPLLDLDLRLGEGTGAARAIDLVGRSVSLYLDMATFGSAGVTPR